MHKDRLGQVIYVGKAINLKRRVSSYFQNSANHGPKVRAMVSHVAEFEYITCNTEVEALILECNLIKKYEPKYNILLRDDKTYPYIKVTTGEPYPRIVKTRIVDRDGARYFGPYSDVTAVNQIIELIGKLFTLKKCSAKSFPKDFKPCLNYHINECKGVCQGNISISEYNKTVEEVIDFLSGKRKPILDSLKDRMLKASEELKFEDAAMYRDYIRAVEALSETQRVTMVGGKDMDIILPVGKDKNTSVALFMVRDGKLSGREIFNMETGGMYDGSEESYEELLDEFIKQYYTRWAVVPPEILVKKPLKEAHLLEEFLEEQSGHKVEIHQPLRGSKRALMELAVRDVIEMTKTIEIKLEAQREKDDTLRNTLADILGIRKDSYRVESYDISNTNGVDTVGAMVVFENLKPVKKDYRRFKIRTIEGQNDYGALQEMLTRRLKRAIDGDPSFSTLPDLILMDGGQGQVTSAESVINALGLAVPVLGMAKDDSHRTRALVNGEGEEFLLRDNPLLFKYCGTIQEEVHRFAIEYHRSLHTKNSIGSILDEIEGIGPKKRTALLNHFKTIDDIKNASVEQLMDCPGINQKNAESIKEFFYSRK